MKILIPILILFILNSCIELDDPMAPSWTTQINIPVKDTIYYLEDAIKKDNNIKIDTNGSALIYRIESDTYRRSVPISEFIEGQLNGNFNNNEIPAATGNQQIVIELSSGAEIDTCFIKSGNLVLNIVNGSSSAGNFTITIPALKDLNDNVFTYSDALKANAATTATRDIANYTYSTTGKTNKSELIIDVTTTMDQSSADKINVQVEIDNSNFYYFKGVIPEKNVKSIRETVSLPITDDAKDYKNKITFTDAKLTIKGTYLSNESPVFGAIFKNIKLEGTSTNSESIFLTKPNGSNLDDFQAPEGNFSNEYNNSNSNVSEFFSFIPDSISVLADILMNPTSFTNRRGIALDTDSILIEYKVEALGVVEIDTLVLNSKEELEIDTDLREELDNVKGARLKYEMINSLPIEINLTIRFLDTLGTETLFTKSKRIQSAKVPSPNFQINPVNIKDELELNEEEILLLAKTYFVDYDIEILTNQEQYDAWFGPKSSVDFKIWTEIDYFIDNNDEEGGNE